MRKCALPLIAVLAACMFISPPLAATANSPAKRLTIAIWPHGAPGRTVASGPERTTGKPNAGLVAGKPVILLTDVSDPTITVYQAAADKATGAAVVVFPGGGYRILAFDLEGTEICHWLNSLGVTAVLLKYRVPESPGVPPYAAPLDDAERAVGYVRYHAEGWHVDPHRIGVIGFSAGGNLVAELSTHFETRTYEPVDAADRASCRPDFAMLIYPAYLVNGQQLDRLAPELKVTANAPPSFLVQTEDDPIHVENSFFYFLALKNAKVPAEMHIYPVGRHGYGLRRTDASVTTWPARAAQWMRSLGVLRKSGSP